MKHFLMAAFVVSIAFSCKKDNNATLAYSINSLVGKWGWTKSYNVGFEPSAVGVNRGTLIFNSDNTWQRMENNATVDHGTYSVFKSKISTADSIQFNRPGVEAPAYPIRDSTYDYYSVSGNTLQLGSIGLQNYIVLYGIVDVYMRE